MIETINYETAVNTRYESTTGVKVYVFKSLQPPCCRVWDETVLYPCAEKYPEFNWYIVILDRSHNKIPFPPATDPTLYFVVPDEEALHFVRPGPVDFEKLDKECAKFLRIHNGEYYSDVLYR